jgi:hypothetical protein
LFVPTENGELPDNMIIQCFTKCNCSEAADHQPARNTIILLWCGRWCGRSRYWRRGDALNRSINHASSWLRGIGNHPASSRAKRKKKTTNSVPHGPLLVPEGMPVPMKGKVVGNEVLPGAVGPIVVVVGLMLG